MFERVIRRLKPKIFFPVAAMLYGLLRVASVYVENAKAGQEMSNAHLAGYALGVLMVWGFVGLLVGFSLDILDRRSSSRKQAEAPE